VHIVPTETNGITKEVGADAFQVKSVSLDRFTTRLGAISPSLLEEVGAVAVALCVGYQGI
jgi:mRNA-degrading endonuclease toxin of MazEF toxin-antitoxin module